MSGTTPLPLLDSPNILTPWSPRASQSWSAWLYFPLTSSQHLPPQIYTTAFFYSNDCCSLLTCLLATSPPIHSFHCSRKFPSQMKRSVNAICLLETLERLRHWGQASGRTSLRDLHTHLFCTLDKSSALFQFFRSQLWILSSVPLSLGLESSSEPHGT